MVKSRKSCVKRIHLVADDDLYDRKAFYTVKIVFLFIVFLLSDKESFYRICDISGTSERIPVRITCNFSHTILCYLFELKICLGTEKYCGKYGGVWNIEVLNYGKSLIIVC